MEQVVLLYHMAVFDWQLHLAVGPVAHYAHQEVLTNQMEPTALQDLAVHKTPTPLQNHSSQTIHVCNTRVIDVLNVCSYSIHGWSGVGGYGSGAWVLTVRTIFPC